MWTDNVSVFSFNFDSTSCITEQNDAALHRQFYHQPKELQTIIIHAPTYIVDSSTAALHYTTVFEE